MPAFPLHEAAGAGDLAALERALAAAQAGGVDAAGPGGVTALMVAARRGRGEAVAWLLDRGAAIDAVDAWGNTALMYAAARGAGAAVALLLARGAAADHANRYGLTARDWARWAADADAIGEKLTAIR